MWGAIKRVDSKNNRQNNPVGGQYKKWNLVNPGKKWNFFLSVTVNRTASARYFLRSCFKEEEIPLTWIYSFKKLIK